MTRTGIVAATALAIQVALLGVAAPAKAVSAGLYGSYGTGAASWDDWGGGDGGGYGRDGDTRHTGAGLALEMPTGFYATSYRLGIGWERIDSEGENGGPDHTLEGLVIDQDITYDLFASPAMRFWIGPELRLGFFQGSFDNASDGDRSYFAAGIGPVLGFDVALSRSVALSWKLGYLFTWYSPDEDYWGDDYYYNDYYYNDYYDGDTIDEGHAYISLSVLFRLGGGPLPGPNPDMYQPQGRW
jgi:hypothetical protein